MTHPTSRLQIAVRIQQLMLGELGHGIVVERMLAHERYARDVLLVCDALRGSELATLAQAFRDATLHLGVAGATAGHGRQPTAWAGAEGDVRADPPPPLPPESGAERRRGWAPWRRR